MLTLYPTTFPHSLIRSSRYLAEPREFSMYTMVTSVNKDSFTSSVPILMPFISSPCLITVPSTCSTMLNTGGESRHPRLLPNLKGNTCSFCPLILRLAGGFSTLWPLSCLDMHPLFSLCRGFYHKLVLDFIKCFFCIY